jgi:DUF917 family protein
MGTTLDKFVEEIKTHILSSATFSENRTTYEIMSKNWVETEGRRMTSQHGEYAFQATCTYAHAHAYDAANPHTATHAQTDQ